MNQAFWKVFQSIQSFKPHLSSTFVNLHDYLAKRMPMDAEALHCVEQLAYASEYLYIDHRSILEKAIARHELPSLSRLLYDLASRSNALARAFLESYRQLPYPLSGVCDALSALIDAGLAKLPQAADVLSFCLSWSEDRVCLFFLQQIKTIVGAAPAVCAEAIQFLQARCSGDPSQAFNGSRTASSFQNAAAWLTRATDLMSSNRVEEGVRFLQQRTRESRALLGLKHAVLDDMKNILKIYAASLADREMHVVALDASAYAFSFPYTDGKSIFLPLTVDYFDDTALNERVYTVMAAQQAASLSLGTFLFDRKAITFSEELTNRYGRQLPRILDHVRRQYQGVARSVRERPDGEIEVTFFSGRKFCVLLTQLEDFFYSFPAPDFARALFVLVENSRIAHALSSRYSGLQKDYSLINRFLHSKRRAIAGYSPEHRFLQVLDCLMRFALVGQWNEDILDAKSRQIVKTMAGHFEGVLKPDASVQDSARVCFLLFNSFFDNYPIVGYCQRHDIREDFANPVWPEIVPEVVYDVSPELVVEIETRPPYDDVQEQEAQTLDLTATSEKEGDDRLRTALSDGSLKVYQYPEFDYTRGGFLERHCTLFERELPSLESGTLETILQNYQQVYKRIKKRFLMMQPEAVEMSRRWVSGDEIHLSDAVDYTTDLMREVTPDEKIYFRKMRSARDIAAAILLDASSSTDERIREKKIIELEKTALCLLAGVLHVIDDRFGIFTFFSQGRQRVFFNVVKDFSEAWNKKTQGRIDSIAAYASNRDGCAIRHAAARLQELPEKTKLLILLSDGIPADLGYGGDSSAETSEYAIEDTRKAILECRMKGIVPFCLTIDRFAKKYIPRLYGDYHYVVLDDVFTLPEKLSKLYLRLTR